MTATDDRTKIEEADVNGSLVSKMIVDVHAHHSPPGLTRRSDQSQVLALPIQEPFEARFARMRPGPHGLIRRPAVPRRSCISKNTRALRAAER